MDNYTDQELIALEEIQNDLIIYGLFFRKVKIKDLNCKFNRT